MNVNKMQVMMMAAGSGSRLVDEKKVPKPFVKVLKQDMYSFVADKIGLDGTWAFPTSVVFNVEHSSTLIQRSVKKPQFSTFQVIPSMTSMGPAWSVITATLADKQPDHPILLLDCDCFMEPEGTQRYHEQMSQMVSSIFETSALGDMPIAFVARAEKQMEGVAKASRQDSYWHLEEGGCEDQERFAIGSYYFPSIVGFRENAVRAMLDPWWWRKQNRELKISDVFNKAGGTCKLIHGSFQNLGTNEQLTEYLEKNA